MDLNTYFENYNKSPLMVPFEAGSIYKELRIENTLCTSHPIHMHDCIEIIFVVKGLIYVKEALDEHEVAEGECIVINTFDLHRIYSMEEGTIISCIHFSENIFGTGEGFIENRNDVMKRNDEANRLLREALELLIEKYRLQESEQELLRIAKRIIDIFKNEFRWETYDSRGEKNNQNEKESSLLRIRDIYIYLYVNHMEKLTLDRLSKHFGISKYYLSRYIKERFGYGFSEYMNLIRSERSEQTLLESNKNISDVGYEHGFSSLQYFNKCFREYFGLTPKEYRSFYMKETVMFKEFEEEEIDILECLKKVDKRQNEEITELEISLKEGVYKLMVVTIDENKYESMLSYKIKNKEKLKLDFDNDEVVLIIKKQNSK